MLLIFCKHWLSQTTLQKSEHLCGLLVVGADEGSGRPGMRGSSALAPLVGQIIMVVEAERTQRNEVEAAFDVPSSAR